MSKGKRIRKPTLLCYALHCTVLHCSATDIFSYMCNCINRFVCTPFVFEKKNELQKTFKIAIITKSKMYSRMERYILVTKVDASSNKPTHYYPRQYELFKVRICTWCAMNIQTIHKGVYRLQCFIFCLWLIVCNNNILGN